MARVEIKWRSGLLRDVANSREVSDGLRRRGEKVLSRARSLAPVVTGDYLASLHLTTEKHPTRVAVHVGSSDPGAGPIEARHHVLRRALEAGRG